MTHEEKLWQKMELKADMFDYLCWLERVRQPKELRDADFLCLASDGTTCWAKSYADAVRVAMEHDKGLQDASAPDAPQIAAQRTDRTEAV